MELTLQQIADAAVRHVETRDARIRRAGRSSRGGVKRVSAAVPVRITLPVPVTTERMVRRPRRSAVPVAVPVPVRRYVALFTAGLVLLAAGWMGLSWARASVTWQEEARGQRRALILQQGQALHAQIGTLALQAERLEEKARILVQYASDLRHSFYGDAGAGEMEQANRVLADRDRLLGEIADRRRQLAELRQEAAALHVRP